jgi:transposase
MKFIWIIDYNQHRIQNECIETNIGFFTWTPQYDPNWIKNAVDVKIYKCIEFPGMSNTSPYKYNGSCC